MGHLEEKYTAEYFLGGVDTDTGCSYGVVGHQEFQTNRRDDRHLQEFEFCRSLVGSLAGKDVLEIGFGRGDHIPLFLEAGVASYSGIDFSPSAVGIAESRFNDHRVNLSCMDATELDAKQAYDIVTLYDVVEHIPAFEMGAVWEHVHRALRPTGYVVVSTPIFDNPNADDHTDNIPSVAGVHCNKQTWGTLVRACLQHGFTIASSADRMLGLVRTEDLHLFGARAQEGYREAQARLMERLRVPGFDGNLTRAIDRALVSGAGRVAIGCVADNEPRFLSQALRLLQSVRWFGGTMSGVNFFACFVDEVDPEYAHEFERLGAFVRTLPRYSDRHPHSNKLRFLELPGLQAYDTVMLLDCDTLIVRDPWEYLDGEVFQAKLADIASIPHEVFQRVFAHFGVELPAQDFRCNPAGTPTIWYCNAGVLVFPHAILNDLCRAWQHFNNALLERLDLLPHPFHCDQVSLSLAFASCGVPFRELPLEMNFPIHLTDFDALPTTSRSDPVILHYHDRVDASGYLLPASFPGAQRRIELFNERLRESRCRRFNNRLFWDFRYAHDPVLGSGYGSRGAVLNYKRELVRSFVDQLKPKSVLDIGCGDCEVGAELPDELYTGIDISPVAVEQNRARLPHRRFVCGSFLDIDLDPADLVVCFDVLIHLVDGDVYESFVKRLVTEAGTCGLVSGYEEDPNAGRGMVFYHEPLSKTLRRFGARGVREVGHYNKVTVWYYERAHAESRRALSETVLRSPVFMVGCMRSATTLLAKLLDRSPGIVHCPFELKHIWSGVGGVPMASAKTRDTVCPELDASDAKPGQAERLARAFLEEMHKGANGKRADAVFLNKNPHLCNKLPFVNALFPDARFIWIHRPLPAVVASVKRLFADVQRRQETWHYWPEPSPEVQARCWHAVHQKAFPDRLEPERVFPGGNVQFLAEYWLESNRAIASFLATLPADRWIEVEEDALISDPEAQVARCLMMLGQPVELSQDAGAAIEPPRNHEWESLLSEQEQAVLADFTSEHETEIAEILATRNPVFPYPDEPTAAPGTSRRDSHYRVAMSRDTFSGGPYRSREDVPMPICITGMHRSGTSMIARLLHRCGLYLGDESDLLGAAPDNPEGYWENVHFKELNEQILDALGGGWDLPPVVTEGWERKPELAAVRSEAARLVQGFAEIKPWGWKDPRNSLTIPFWKSFFPDLKAVICLRNPLEVVYSLQKRGYSSRAFGLNLWLTYNQRLLAATRPEQRIVTHYEAYCVEPRKELRRVLDWLEWPVSDAAVDEVCATLSVSLRHNRVTALELLAADAPEEVVKLYFLMCADAGPVYEQLLHAELAAPREGAANEADTYCKCVLPHHPDQKVARRHYALLLQAAGSIDEAIEQYELIVSSDATDAQAHNDMGVLHYQQHRYERAIEQFERCLAIDDGNLAALKNLGVVYLTVGRTQDAMRAYQRVLSEEPRDIDTLLLLGDVCHRVGRNEKAAFFYRKVLEIDPGNASAGRSIQLLGA
jgi:2-polyprenyl-3-methyl-5-hydroxy-6-metoxy-1,4-benzoquinol methylase/tetratricopeptide (TPR) repeat protein